MQSRMVTAVTIIIWLQLLTGATAQNYLRFTSSETTPQEVQIRDLQLQVVRGSIGTSQTKLGKCQGDCDKNSDCQDGLKCFQRQGNEPVPGCYTGPGGDTLSKQGVDFCYDPNDEAANTQESFATASATTTATSNGVGTSRTQTERTWTWAGGTGTAQVATTNGNDSSLTKVKVVVGISGTPSSKLRACQGDCDRDSECANGLKCFQRSGNEPVPGCSDISAAHWSIDFCYDPNFDSKNDSVVSNNENVKSELPSLVVVVGLGGKASRPLAECEGDCDADNECESGLVCMQRTANEAVPGCTGYTAARSGIDFCFDPKKDENAKPIRPRPVPSPTQRPVPSPVRPPPDNAPVGTEGTAVRGQCQEEQLNFGNCLTGKPLCRQCFAPILGQQLNCDSLQEKACTVINTDACECDRCAGVFKDYYDCVSSNICSALTCDADTIIKVPDTPSPTRAPVSVNAPTSPPVPEHNYKGSTELKYVGDNDDLKEPLGRCEGDCDKDDDCDSDLVCFQRTASESTLVPGCNGTPERDRDYCIDPLDNPSRINSDTFRIKLFWRDGYRWQDEDFERPWCLDCEKGKCRELGILVVSKCDDDNARFNFINPSADSVQISVAKEKLCLEVISDLDRRRLRLEKCDSGNIYQRFLAGEEGNFNGDRFELQPIARPGCLTQRHHPKEQEYVYLETCEDARRDKTSFWNKY